MILYVIKRSASAPDHLPEYEYEDGTNIPLFFCEESIGNGLEAVNEHYGKIYYEAHSFVFDEPGHVKIGDNKESKVRVTVAQLDPKRGWLNKQGASRTFTIYGADWKRVLHIVRKAIKKAENAT